MLNFKHLSNKNLFLILLFYSIFQIVFEIILFDDLLLPNKDTILEFELTRNYILFNKPFYSFTPSSSVYIYKFDFFTFYSIFLNIKKNFFTRYYILFFFENIKKKKSSFIMYIINFN